MSLLKMSECFRPFRPFQRKEASANWATTLKIFNQFKLMMQPAYANELASEAEASQGTNQAERDPLTNDKKFELLSAYMDGECSHLERQLVEHWLASDPAMSQQYKEQLQLQQALKAFLQTE